MNDLEAQTVVIIGGSSGMGLGAAQVAATQGATVIIAAHSQDKLDKALTQIEGQAKALAVDITDESSTRQLFEQIEQLDHLLITAALGARGEFLKQSIADARRYMDSKFWGAYTAAYYAVPRMPPHGSLTFLSGTLKSQTRSWVKYGDNESNGGRRTGESAGGGTCPFAREYHSSR